MQLRWNGLARLCRHVVMVLLLAALIVWLSAAPLAWILRDGLAPGMIETTGLKAVTKFVVGWGTPGLVLAVPLLALWIIERRANRASNSDLRSDVAR